MRPLNSGTSRSLLETSHNIVASGVNKSPLLAPRSYVVLKREREIKNYSRKTQKKTHSAFLLFNNYSIIYSIHITKKLRGIKIRLNYSNDMEYVRQTIQNTNTTAKLYSTLQYAIETILLHCYNYGYYLSWRCVELSFIFKSLAKLIRRKASSRFTLFSRSFLLSILSWTFFSR